MAGSIDKIKDKFRVTFELGKDANGKRLRKFTTFKTEAEAKKALNEHVYNLQRNLLVKSTDVTLAEFLDIWMDQDVKRNCQETTIYGYKNVINKHLVPYMGSIKLQKLEPAMIQRYYGHLQDEKDLSPNTVQRHHDLLRRSLQFGLRQQYVYRNVADAVTLPKKRKFEGTPYTPEQLKTLFEKAKDTRMELPVYLAGYLGLRREEILGLKWTCVDLEQRVLKIEEVRTAAGGEIVVKAPKSEKSRRMLYIVDELFDLLIKHRQIQDEYKEMLGSDYEDSGYVFVREDGKPYRINSVTEHFKELLEKYGLPRIRLHDLRHTFASILYAQKVDIKAISEALGHSDIGITSKIYTHLFDKTHQSTVSAMSKALNR